HLHAATECRKRGYQSRQRGQSDRYRPDDSLYMLAASWTDSTARRDPSPAEYWRPVSRDRDRSPNSCDECAVSRQGAQTATSHCRRWSASGWLLPSSRRDRREPKVLHIELLCSTIIVGCCLVGAVSDRRSP